MIGVAWLTSVAVAAPVQLHLTGLRNADGVVWVSAWRNEAGFPMQHPKAAAQWTFPASGSDMVVAVDVSPGDWAFTVIHDENTDGSLNTNWLGMPAEGVGASVGRSSFRLGPPRFSDAVVAVGPTGASFNISVSYLL